MPIQPPNLDNRRYDDIVREARALIPQYCPEWTNLGDADPGMTMVQLFAWMTEMIIFRLNRVPDKTYIHFLNFIGEERRQARPSTVSLTFDIDADIRKSSELPAYSSCTAQPGDEPLHYLTTAPLTISAATPNRVVAVRAGKRPMVREVAFLQHPETTKALLFGGGRGVQLFEMDPIEHGPRAYTAHQYLYIAHDDFKRMTGEAGPGPVGRMRIRSAEGGLPVGALFRWEYRTADEDSPWQPIPVEEEEEQVLGLPEVALTTQLPGLVPLEHFGVDHDPCPKPEKVAEEQYWIRGVVDYERWLSHRMQEDLEITWRDDRGGEERAISNWDVRDTGRYLEFFVQDMPPIRPGWTLNLTMVDRSMPAGRTAYVPKYRWSFRRGEAWESVAADRVRYQGTQITLTGPFPDMANDGFNLRAERLETAHIRGFIPKLNVEMTWVRPIGVHLGWGLNTGAASPMPTWELPFEPFQAGPNLPALLGMKMFLGSDLFENRAGKSVIVEIEFGFELDGELIEEPDELYKMQITYRASDSWRTVYDKAGTFNECTFASLDQDEDGNLLAAKRRIRIELDPKAQLRGLHRTVIAGTETTWLRFELTKANLSWVPDEGAAPIPYILRIFGVKLGLKGAMGLDTYEEPMPGPKMAIVEHREENRRLSRTLTRSAGKLSEDYPFDTFIDVEEDEEDKSGHNALYLRFDHPFPAGNRHAILFNVRGESYLPDGVTANWEVLEDAGSGRLRWGRLSPAGDAVGQPTYRLNHSGVLAFSFEDDQVSPEHGNWMRCILRMPDGKSAPVLPPLTHMLCNTVDAVNLHAFRMEKFSGLGVPHQTIQLRHFPLYLHRDDERGANILHKDRFADIRVWVTERDGARREWRRSPGNSMLTSTKDDRVFIVDAVEGSLRFGNGIRGRILPVGSFNITVELYHTVPGGMGNVGAGQVKAVDGHADHLKVINVMPASGGRNAESIAEIIRRAPSVLTSRDRAVTRLDFEVIAKEASAEVARAACDGKMAADGCVGMVVLPHRREGERVPDPFLSAGLKEHVRKYVSRRCLVNVQPVVRLASFQPVDVSVIVRMRPNTNFQLLRERANAWVARFLDPYEGGLDGSGWPFNGTLYAQDFGRMVSDIPEIRHVVEVQLFRVSDSGPDDHYPGWERGQGTSTMVLDSADLFVLRHVRVSSEDGVE